MKSAIYPGSFDPMTKGHIDIIEKALMVFDEIFVVIAINPDKKHMFSIEERTEIVKRSLKDLNIPEGKSIKLIPYRGVISNLAKDLKITAMIRGMRNSHDMQDEYAIEQFTEKSTNKSVVTVYFSPSPQYIFTSSTLVRNFINCDYFEEAEKYMNKNAFEYLRLITLSKIFSKEQIDYSIINLK